MRDTIRISYIIALLITAFLSSLDSHGEQRQVSKLSSAQYTDPKGYFKIVPPEGWETQEYPQDVRGKVAFIGPGPGIDLRVLTNVVDFNTIENLVVYCKSGESRIGVSTNIEQITFEGRPAVKRSFELKGLKFYMIDFLVGQIDYNLQFSAPPSEYGKHLPVILKSIKTCEPIAKESSEKLLTEHFVAKKLRLAQLMIDDGHYDLANEFIKEGLAVSPKDPGLLKLKALTEAKSK
jgi:hypothetical protein